MVERQEQSQAKMREKQEKDRQKEEARTKAAMVSGSAGAVHHNRNHA
jgi:hypothetical protein